MKTRLKKWIEKNEAIIEEFRYSMHLLRKNHLSLVGLIICLGFIAIALLSPFISRYNPLEMHYDDRLLPPSPQYWFGTDEHGRDLFSRILNGAQISLSVGIIVIGIAVSIGSTVGAVAGYLGGKVDSIFMRITDVFFAFPSLLLAMAVAAAIGRSLTSMMLAIAFVSWPTYARLMRGQALGVREELFVEGARAIGASRKRIIFRHIIPNCLSPIIVQASIEFGGVIMTAAGLSFIGFGTQAPTPEWGLLISEGRRYIMNQWWLCVFPGIAIFLTVLGFNLLGDGLRDILDPRMRRV